MAEKLTGMWPPAGKMLNTTLVQWGTGKAIFRVHRSIYKANQFNDRRNGNARFSPLIDVQRNEVIPTLYAGTSVDCALMETVFHDVPYQSGLKTVSKTKYVAGTICSTLNLADDLCLIDLSSVVLHKLGTAPSQLTQTEAAEYPASREWARVLCEQNPSAQGLIWTSRRDDQAEALLLLGNRVDPDFVQVEKDAFPLLLPDRSACMEVLRLAARLDVLIVP